MTAVVAMKVKMREDVVTDGEMPGAVLANAPSAAGEFFAVPKVVE
jgi:aspartyl-tRNA(Asn)/glutamyl-tRNA(Gln) amidotransferase subunit C